MENLGEQLKPILAPILDRIEVLEEENKKMREICQNAKKHEKHHVKPHENHGKTPII